ncbi:MAG: hypothetical protein EOP05_14580, partial [Proteobacteria bacterium]
MSIQKSLVLAYMCSLALLVTACGSDKNSSPNTATAAHFAKVEASGLFAGELKSNTGNSGGLINMKVGQGAGDSNADLSGSVTASLATLALTNEGSTLSQDVAVVGIAAPIQFSTTFDGAAWVGSLTAPGSKTVYTFKLTRVSETQSGDGYPKLAPSGVYKGKFVYKESGG